jgi:hypothetical protein
MALAALLAAGVSVVAVGRDRRGDMQGWLSARQWALQTTDRGVVQARFRSPAHAQQWFEWREKGWMIPICFIAMHSVIVTIQFLTGDTITDVLRSAPGIGVASVLSAGFGAGMLMGHLNLPRGKVEITTFLATRPASDLALASATLKSTAAGLAVAWGLWLIMALASGLPQIIVDRVKALGVGQFVYEELPEIILVPLSVLAASWILPAVLVPVGLTGRRWLLLLVVSVPSAVLLVYAFLHVLASQRLQDVVEEAMTNTLLVAMIAGPALAFHVAAKAGKCLIRVPWAALLWLGLWGLPASWFASRPDGVDWQFVALLAGLAALVISPLATAPLAVSWNRHR